MSLDKRFKLYKVKKQWFIGCAATLLAVMVGTVRGHADTQKLTNDASEETQVIDQRGTGATTNDTGDQATKSSTNPVSTNTSTTSAPTSSVDESSADNKVTDNQNSQSDITVDNNYQEYQPFTVDIQVPGLSYTIPKFNPSSSDLRLLTNEEVSHITNWHQPALINGQAINVGTYLVVLSQTGYNQLLAWINGEYVDNEWVPNPNVVNIVLPPYNLSSLISMGFGKLIIKPFPINVTLTGNSVLPVTGVLDPEKYAIKLSSADATLPIDGVDAVTRFYSDFKLVNGDIEIGSTPDADGSYPVTLTKQGWQNVYTALLKAFNSYGNVDHEPNFVVSDRNSIATAIRESVLNKTVTRTIKVTFPDGSTKTITQTAKVSRTATEVTGKVTYGPWQVAENGWTAYDAPAVDGWTPTIGSVATGNPLEGDQTIEISYTKLPSSMTTPTNGSAQENTNQTPSNGGRTPSNGGSFAQGQTTAASDSQAKQLPQTGNDANQAGVVGLALASMAGLLGFGLKRKKED
ncbi:mucin-binding protein [Limosilactobacillus caecicola]|uniref:mucin-binding protein n=1 Tax=Limosilactobacillus caecicola TaxID=2941332 RepID=UPI00203FF44A|nr:LPXTG cell wall anchor domain-containing protein [Limosilactobacillus caecicola]